MNQYIKGYKDENGTLKVGVFNEGENTPIIERTIENEEQLKQVINEWEKRHSVKEESIKNVISKQNNNVNQDYDEIKVDKDGNVVRIQRNNNFKHIVGTTIGVTLGVAVAGGLIIGLYKGSAALINKIKNSNKDDKKQEASGQTADYSLNGQITEKEKDNNIEIQDSLKEYTKEEKQEFIKNNITNFKNEIASVTGVTLNNNEALIQLGFINGLTPSDVNVETENYWLDFANDYNAILDELTVPVINHLSFDKSLKGSNPNLKESLYKNYILDEKDKKIYGYFADNMQVIIAAAYESEKGNALDTAYEFNRSIAETLVYPNNPIQKDNVKTYLKAKQELIEKNNKIPTYEEIANKMDLTTNNVRQLEVASLSVDTASKEAYFMVTLVAQKTVQMLPQDTLICYTNTLGEEVNEKSLEDEQIMNYNAKHGNPNNQNDENYMHSKYLLQDIEYYMENTIVNILAEYEEKDILCNEKVNDDTRCCSVTPTYNSNKTYVKKLKNYHSMQSYL